MGLPFVSWASQAIYIIIIIILGSVRLSYELIIHNLAEITFRPKPYLGWGPYNVGSFYPTRVYEGLLYLVDERSFSFLINLVGTSMTGIRRFLKEPYDLFDSVSSWWCFWTYLSWGIPKLIIIIIMIIWAMQMRLSKSEELELFFFTGGHFHKWLMTI